MHIPMLSLYLELRRERDKKKSEAVVCTELKSRFSPSRASRNFHEPSYKPSSSSSSVMSGELQATVEFSVEFLKFYNVDLFQRG